jgi:hypothetical protein
MRKNMTPLQIRLGGFFALGVLGAACAFFGCGGGDLSAAESSALLATPGASVTCTQDSPGRATNRQTVTATIDASGAPTDVSVWRGPAVRLEHAAAAATSLPGYQAGYYEQTYGLLAWALGSEGENDYYLLLPQGGIPAGVFSAQLHLYFNHGDSGWWQKVLTCTAQ